MLAAAVLARHGHARAGPSRRASATGPAGRRCRGRSAPRAARSPHRRNGGPHRAVHRCLHPAEKRASRTPDDCQATEKQDGAEAPSLVFASMPADAALEARLRAAQRQLQLADRADALFGQAVGGLVGRDAVALGDFDRCARGCGRSCASCASRVRGCSRRSRATRSSRRPRSPRSPARRGCRASRLRRRSACWPAGCWPRRR